MWRSEAEVVEVLGNRRVVVASGVVEGAFSYNPHMITTLEKY
jgi:hypothetical protein